ncbi:MAG TPA: hypothetical protein VEH27_02845 [Methylomirabilota bacterium]|nr:hypothetical protein [Methylomirabilota bacterium]
MQRAILLILLSAALATSSHAQEKADVSTPTQPAAGASAATPSSKVKETDKNPPPLVKERIIVTSGFLVELKRAENKKKFLSLRQKADPIKDAENIWTEPRSGRPMGVRLFSLSF